MSARTIDLTAKRLVCSGFILCCLAQIAFAQNLDPSFQKLYERWNVINSPHAPKDFTPILKDLQNYRNSNGGKSWQVDYMLGVAYCRTSGFEELGNQLLGRVLRNLLAPESARSAATQVIAWCGTTKDGPENSPSFQLTSIPGLNQGGVLNKGGYEIPEADSTEFNSSEESSPDLLIWDERLFPQSKAKEAVAAADNRVRGFFLHGAFASGFVIETEFGTAAGIGSCLASYRTALQAEFGMVAPPDLITVYALVSNVGRLAQHLHLLKMPLGTVAYSVPQDLSIVGIGTEEHCGTLAHEMTHLLMRQDFGDSPAWLEEGLASEVAVSVPAPNGLVMKDSWRDSVLRKEWQRRPNVASLFLLNWANFTTNHESDIERVAATHAMAASFVRYLDAQNKLLPLYRALRDIPSTGRQASDIEIFANVMGKSPEQVDKDFAAWFKHAATSHETALKPEPEKM